MGTEFICINMGSKSVGIHYALFIDTASFSEMLTNEPTTAFCHYPKNGNKSKETLMKS
jgi:hypothetical protein